MQIISKILDPVKNIMGRQTLKQDVQYRMLTYCKLLEIDDGALLYNLLTKEMLLLNDEEKEGVQNFADCPKELSEYLISNWFFVPCDMDDRKLYNQVKTVVEMTTKKSKNISQFTVFTTMDCNARCFYCYELGRKRSSMSEQTAIDAAEYMKKHCGTDIVRLKWFGGEPLFNEKVIDIICDSLSKDNIEYFSIMTSNGYLFDEEMVKKAKNEWKLRQIQITLDGTEEIYNKSKAYIYKEGSAFQRVLNNIESLLREQIKVQIRLNMDKHNSADLFELCEYLHSRFNKYKGYVCVYAALLFESDGPRRTDEERHNLYMKFFELQDLIEEKGLAASQKIKRQFRLNYCMADGADSVTITPEGKLGKCEHFSDSELWGDIYSDECDEDMIASWKERRPDIEECKDCTFYPDCIRLKKCEEDFYGCTSDVRMLKERALKRAMVNTYKIFLKNKENNTNEK